MKALSIKDPWASMILNGSKTIETRTWKTKYLGPLLLCASKKPESLISGMAFAVANLIDCREMMVEDVPAAGCDLYPSANAWVLEDVTPVIMFPVKGKLGIFDVDVTNYPILWELEKSEKERRSQ